MNKGVVGSWLVCNRRRISKSKRLCEQRELTRSGREFLGLRRVDRGRDREVMGGRSGKGRGRIDGRSERTRNDSSGLEKLSLALKDGRDCYDVPAWTARAEKAIPNSFSKKHCCIETSSSQRGIDAISSVVSTGALRRV